MKQRLMKYMAFTLCLCLIFGMTLSVPASADVSDSITLTEDTSYDETKVILKDTTLELNGHTLSFTGTAGSVFRVENGATLTIKDSSENKTGKITGGNAAIKTVTLASNGTFGGGMAVDDRNGSGGGVFVATGGALVMTQCH